MAEKLMVKKDLSWREKLSYIWCILRFSKHMANWIVMNCEHCHHHELVRIGKPVETDNGNVKEFMQRYRCLHCGAVGKVKQKWIKEHDEDDRK